MGSSFVIILHKAKTFSALKYASVITDSGCDSSSIYSLRSQPINSQFLQGWLLGCLRCFVILVLISITLYRVGVRDRPHCALETGGFENTLILD